MARSKIKKYAMKCTNYVQSSNFLELLSKKEHILNQDNFDLENENYELVEHGLSTKSYKIAADNHMLSNNEGLLNNGRIHKRYKRRRWGLNSDEVRRIMEDL